MRALFGVVVAMGTLLCAGCAQVKVAQRNGCWVKQTETFPKTIREEVGPCSRKEPRWSEDRVARLVQECMAEADYRWQHEALSAFNRGAPLPPQKSEQTVMRECMDHASTTVMLENEALRRELAQTAKERDALQAVVEQDREHLHSNQTLMTEALGEAAKKPAPSAYAVSNSTGTASTQSDQSADPGTPVLLAPQQPAPINVEVNTPGVPVQMSAPPAELAPKPEAKAQVAKEPAPTCSSEPKSRSSRTKGKSLPVCPPAAPLK